ncbi:MAG TPA: MarR family transcriptional regulator [Hyphomicrobiaceae bacterium]|nr:MarR family transcriptional regulator [Hyphomicrobiaceae bacterium]
MKRSRRAPPRTQEEKAAPPVDFDELPSYVGYQVRRAQATIFADFEAALAGADLTPGSFGVLTLIRANPGITQVALAAAFGVDKSTLSPVIVRLEARGLVRREVSPRDRRRHALYLAAGAEPRYLAARERVRAFETGVASRLTKPEQRTLARLLAKLQGAGGRP